MEEVPSVVVARWARCFTQVQGIALTVNAVGDESLLVQVPWKPNDAFPPGLIEALYAKFVAVTAAPVWVTVAFHALVTFWSPGKVQRRVHAPMLVVPVLSMVTLALKPPDHSLAFEYATWQANPAPPPVVVGAPVGVPVAVAVGDAVVAVALGVGVAVPVVVADALAVGVPVTVPAMSP